MTIKDILITRYGAGTHKQSSLFKRSKLRLSSAKNRVIFLKRCRFHQVIPRFLRNSCPVKTCRAKRLTRRYQCSLLKECLAETRGQWRKINKKIKHLDSQLKSRISDEHYATISCITDSAYERDFSKRKNKLKNKLEKLLPQRRLARPIRPSTINNPVLELQQSGPLPPEARSLLELETQFRRHS